MLRIFLLLNILFISSYACKGGYNSCKRKINDSNAIVKQNLQIPISKKKTLIFTQNPDKLKKNFQILKSDPFLSLYLVKSKTYFKYPFKFNKHLSLGVAAVNKNVAQEGRLRKRQVGLNKLALFDDAVFAPSLLMTSCCSLEGLITQEGIIEKVYVKHFLNSKKIRYGDFGIRVKDKKGRVVVISSDPFMKKNLFKQGDFVVSIDGKNIKKASLLMQKILFSKIGSTHQVNVIRKGKKVSFKIYTQKRYGGGYISDTFLEQKGLYFDKNLFVKTIQKSAKKYALKVGDRLIQVNGVKVDNQESLREYIGDFKESSLLLFQRTGFQFFVHIN